jgi:hypothetical protein
MQESTGNPVNSGTGLIAANSPAEAANLIDGSTTGPVLNSLNITAATLTPNNNIVVPLNGVTSLIRMVRLVSRGQIIEVCEFEFLRSRERRAQFSFLGN